MAVATLARLARLRREPFADLPIAQHLDQLCRDAKHVWRDTLLSPLVTLRLFVLQILHGNTAITHLRQLSGVGFAPASYCEARQRFPLGVLDALLGRMVDVTRQLAAPLCAAVAQRVLIVDGSSFSMSDTPTLREHFGLPPSTIAGVGYPVAKLMGLLDAASGLFVGMLALPLLVHDMRHVVRLHAVLRTGDILLADRALCSFAHVALLNAAGVFACFRLHQRRKTTRRRGRERWRREGKSPVWMTHEQWLTLPQSIDVRIVRYTIHARGRRTRHVALATTLLDERAWPDARLAALYGQRWEIETCFDHLKTTMRMNVLKCQSVQGVLKELAVYLLVYNLVRLAMLRHAHACGVEPARVSFIDALRWLCCRMAGLGGVPALLINPYRPGRRDPRVIRRRLKEYNLMKRPRAELKCSETFGENR
jgi:Transposase DDE domain.